MNQDIFDCYVPLGYNCEVAFQMRRVLGGDKANFFNWNISPLDAVISLLSNNFSDILEDGNLVQYTGDLYLDKSHGYAIHADFNTPDPQDDPEYAAKLQSLREKVTYFVGRFRSLDQAGRAVFFYKPEETENVEERIRTIRDLLTRYIPIASFELVIAQPISILSEQYDDGNIHYRQLTRTAPPWDAHDGHVSSWDRIFSEFPHADGLRLAGY